MRKTNGLLPLDVTLWSVKSPHWTAARPVQDIIV